MTDRRPTEKQMIEEIVSICKGSFSLTYNEHKTNGETVAQYFHRIGEQPGPEALFWMHRLDTIVEITMYLNNSVANYTVYHWEREEALYLALQVATEERVKRG